MKSSPDQLALRSVGAEDAGQGAPGEMGNLTRLQLSIHRLRQTSECRHLRRFQRSELRLVDVWNLPKLNATLSALSTPQRYTLTRLSLGANEHILTELVDVSQSLQVLYGFDSHSIFEEGWLFLCLHTDEEAGDREQDASESSLGEVASQKLHQRHQPRPVPSRHRAPDKCKTIDFVLCRFEQKSLDPVQDLSGSFLSFADR